MSGKLDDQNKIKSNFETQLAGWREASSSIAAPLWTPTDKSISESNIGRFLAESEFSDYDELYEWSIKDRPEFWRTTTEKLGILFSESPQSILDVSAGVTQPDWLSGATLNIVESCFKAGPDSPAMVCSSPDGSLDTISVGELKSRVMRVAGAIRQNGFGKGDALAIVMPMTPESVVIYLGIIAAGCVAVSIADSFAAPEIETRVRIANAKGIFCAGSFERAGRSIDLFARVKEANAPTAIVIGNATLRDGDIAFDAFVENAVPLDAFEYSAPSQHVNILFSSGTTGDPKAIPWSQTVPIKCASDGYWHHDIREGDTVVWPTNIGWMMGPWLIFATLINRATIGLYHDAPVGEGFGQFVQDAKVTMLGVVPTLVRGWRKTGCMEKCDWTSIRCFSSTGEASSPEDMFYLSWLADFRPIIEYCGGTEIGGGYACSTVVQPNVPWMLLYRRPW